MRKKIISVVCVLTLASALALTACTKPDDGGTTTPDDPAVVDPGPDTSFAWPDNEYTELLPTPDMDLDLEPMISDGFFYASFGDVTLEDAREYGSALKEAGYTVDIAVNEFTDSGGLEVAMYNFVAANEDGYQVTFTWAASGSIATIKFGLLPTPDPSSEEG